MSNKEKCIAILNEMAEEQLANIATILEAAKRAIDEAADDAFCESLYKQYEADPDKGEAISIEEAARQLGVDL
ncbi:hypothetical protein [Anaerotruncus colihominis]|uniref:Uncharacterized protein n=1 Tax=Anaerotruncus colihominis DSM 17241 TaxID=445972 RepID=B0PAK7_9FIRM|nr:hypothetical protein [Anaerotruncus colihominis]EDS11187.1 hypothetical protein ANACOL_01807 [Anaerotruncus colihominis DSM 17241]UWN76513.1 hypothetical protein NQ528_08135 [Anaerotruncus colihominis]DAO23586.1 MAG TPA: hypothetical protein [Caudoviricetes sp.]